MRRTPPHSTPGVGPRVPVTAFQGDAAGLGWDITSGTWFTRPGQVVVNTAQPGTAHLAVGQTIHITVDGKTLTAQITGEVYAPGPPRWSAPCSPASRPSQTRAFTFPSSGTRPSSCPRASRTTNFAPASARARLQRQHTQSRIRHRHIRSSHGVGAFALIDTSLMRRLTIIIAVLAALGVLNSVLMLTRERIHDLGIFKALGMTPPQTILMINCWVAVPAITATIIALPTGTLRTPSYTPSAKTRRTHHSRRHTRLHHQRPRAARPHRPWDRPRRCARPSRLGRHRENHNRPTRRMTIQYQHNHQATINSPRTAAVPANARTRTRH